jgi:type IX secretion system PorP/SprF family membrane protein
MNFNPSHVGNIDYSRLAVGYRNQYPTYKSPFVSYTAMYDLYLEEINSGFGVMVMHDNVGKGVFTTTSFSLAYSNNIRLGREMYIRGGLSLSYLSRKRNPNGLIFPDMPYFNGSIAYPSNYPVIQNSTIYVGFGVTILYKRFKAGAALFNLGGQELSSSTLLSIPNPAKATAYAAYDISVIQRYNNRAIKENVFVVSPYVRYIRQYAFEDIDMGAYFDFNTIFVGLAHRSDTGFKNSTFVVAAGVKTKNFNIAYSANFGNFGNRTHYFSAHEISLILKLKNIKGEHLLQGIYFDKQPSDYQRSRTYKCPY